MDENGQASVKRLTDGLHREFRKRGIAVNNLRAGPMATEGFHMMHEQAGVDTPIDRVHTPDEAAAAASWMIGQPIACSGHILDFDDLIRIGVLPRR